jgi:hypothetical protein
MTDEIRGRIVRAIDEGPQERVATAALDPLFTSAEAGCYLTKSEAALAQWRFRGLGPSYLRMGRSIRYPLSALTAFVSENLQTGGSNVA